MNTQMLKRLISDMSTIIQTHNLDRVDPNAITLLRRADHAVSGSEFRVQDHAQMIEAIRQDNLHPYAS